MESQFEEATAFNSDISTWGTNVWPAAILLLLRDSYLQWKQQQRLTIAVYLAFFISIDVQFVSSMIRMMKGATSFNQNLTAWGNGTSDVEFMEFMFQDATNFNGDISGW